MLGLFKKCVNFIESSQYPLWYFVATFFSLVTLRIFAEFFSNNVSANPPVAFLWSFLTVTLLVYDAESLAHLYAFFSALGLCLVLLLYVYTRHEITRLFKLVTACYGIVVLAPVLDLILSAGRGFRMDYLYPHTLSELARLFFTFFGPMQNAGMPSGITPGIRIEVALVIAAIFIYLRSVHKKPLLRSAIGAVGAYAVIFLFLSAPYVLQIPSGPLGASLELYSETALRNLYLLVGSIAGITLLVLANRTTAVTLLRDMRVPRLLHYWLMIGIGVWMASKTGMVPLTAETIFYLPFLLGAAAFAWLFSVITNNMSDVEIDKVSSPERPLAAGQIDPGTYRAAAWIVLGLSLGLAFAVSSRALFFIGLFLGNYFIYSMPPLRLKCVPYFSKLAILFNSLALALLGFTTFNAADFTRLLQLLYAGRSDFLLLLGTPDSAFAKVLVLVLLAVLLLAMNFIDLKDYEGDKRGGIKTLPILLGLPLSKFLIGGAFLFLYTVAGALIGGYISFIAVGLGLLQFYFINRKKYQEKYVFALYLPSLVALFFIL